MFPIQAVRNIGIAAHIDAGKTTVTERILYFTGVTRKLGEVHDGQATMDFMKEEQERGITIASASISCTWGNNRINIIDTPGHVDFTVEVERSLRVIDGMVAVFCAVEGVEPQSETVWNQADRYHVPRLALVNKMDREGADLAGCIAELDEQLDAHPIALQCPVGVGPSFAGVIDLIEQRAELGDSTLEAEGGVFVPLSALAPEVQQEAARARRAMIEALAELDDELMERYLEGGEIPPELLWRAARHGAVSSLYTPVLCCAAYKNKGIHFLLDAICHLLPSPLDAQAIVGSAVADPTTPVTREPSPEQPLAALAFKAIHDPHIGHQIFVRVYSGALAKGQTVLNAATGRKERIGRILQIEAKKRHEMQSAGPGEIVALVGLKGTTTGDTLCDVAAPVLLETIHVPRPVISVAIASTASRVDEALGSALRKLCLEDPTLTCRTDDETRETIISGMGELHLEIVVSRLRNDFGVEVTTSVPAVAYRETITRGVEINHRLVKQTGGKGQFAHVVMRVEPNAGKGFELEWEVVGGRIPRTFMSAIRTGCEDALARGVVAHYPIVDVKVVVTDGSTHVVDSSDLAFRNCAAQAMAAAVAKASPQLLEPTMKVEIASPDSYLGDILADLHRRRSRISGTRRYRKGSQKVSAIAPLAEMFGYATTLRSLSSGRANCSMEFLAYAPLPEALADEIIAAARRARAASR
jgi:elongation factor G